MNRVITELDLADLIDIEAPRTCGQCSLCIPAYELVGFMGHKEIPGKYMCNHPKFQGYSYPELLLDSVQGEPPEKCPIREAPLLIGRFTLRDLTCDCCGK